MDENSDQRTGKEQKYVLSTIQNLEGVSLWVRLENKLYITCNKRRSGYDNQSECSEYVE